MDDTKSSGCRKLGPIHSLPKPFQIVAEELIVRCALVHKSVAESNCCVEYRVSTFQTIPNFIEDAQIGMIISVQEFKIQFDRLTAVKDLAYAVEDFEFFVGNVLMFWSWGTGTIV